MEKESNQQVNRIEYFGKTYSLKIVDLQGEDLMLEYYILRRDKENNEFNVDTYGIGISMMKENCEIIKDEVTDITTSYLHAEEIIKMLYDGAVTPTTLKDIMYDMA